MSLPPLLIVWAMFAVNAITLSVYPPVSTVPATVRMTVWTPRDAANRSVCVSYHLQAVPDLPIRRSCQPLDGANDRRVRTVYWDVREAGTFDAEAVLTRMEDGKATTYRSAQPFRVIGPEWEEP